MSYVSQILALSPSLFYECGESSGTVLGDSSGNGLTGTLIGATNYLYDGVPLVTDGSVPRSIQNRGFQGISNSGGITTPAIPGIGPTTAVTIIMWTSASYSPFGTTGTLSQFPIDAVPGFALESGGNAPPVLVAIGSGSYSPAYSIAAGKHMIAWVLQNPGGGSTALATLYIDGVQVSQNATANAFTVNQSLEFLSSYWTSSFSAISVHLQALSLSQIDSLYAAGTTVAVAQNFAAGANVRVFTTTTHTFGAGAALRTGSSSSLAAGARIAAKAKPTFGAGAWVFTATTSAAIAAAAHVAAKTITAITGGAAVAAKVAKSIGATALISIPVSAVKAFGAGAAIRMFIPPPTATTVAAAPNSFDTWVISIVIVAIGQEDPQELNIVFPYYTQTS